MDSSNDKISNPGVFVPTEQFDDPKVTSLESHLKKKQIQYQASEPASLVYPEQNVAIDKDLSPKPTTTLKEEPKGNGTKPALHSEQTKQPVNENRQKQPPHAEKDEVVETAPHVFTEQIELAENDLNELQNQILERIQNATDEEAESCTEHPGSNAEEVVNPDIPAAISAGLKANAQTEEVQKAPSLETVAEVTPPLIYTSKTKPGETIESLQRWLDKPSEEEKGVSTPVVVGLCVAMIAIGSLAGGVVVAAMTAKDKKEAAREAELNRQKEAAYQDYRSQIASTTNQHSSEKQTVSGKSGSRNRNSGRGGSGGGKGAQAKAALLVAIPTLAAGTSCVSRPTVIVSPLNGGRTKVAIASPCHYDQKIKMKYAGVTFNRRLNQKGNATLTLDLFAGDKENIEVTFPDKSLVVKKPVAKDLNKVSKVAIIWNDPINLDLHAFEYAANETENGHIWEKHPSNFEQALDTKQRTGLGRGFLSTASTDRSDNPKIEVYTFIKAPEQKQGVIKLALNHQAPSPATGQVTGCSTRESTIVDYTTVQLKQNETLKKGQAAFVIEPCTARLIAGNQMNSRAIQDLVIGR